MKVLTISKLLILLVTVLLLTSCAEPLLKANNSENRHKLSGTDLSNINGDYEIITVDTVGTTLTAAFMPDKLFHFENLPDTNDKISIQVVATNKIRMMLIDDGNVIRQRTIKFILTDNHIEFKRSYISPFWLLINGHTNAIVRLGLTTEGNLTMYISVVTIGFLGFIPFTGAGDTQYNLVYARKGGSC